jgi:hypothetical protein
MGSCRSDPMTVGITRLKRTEPEGSPAAVFTHAKMELLKRSSPTARGNQLYDLNYYIMAVARLGDYLARHQEQSSFGVNSLASPTL